MNLKKIGTLHECACRPLLNRFFLEPLLFLNRFFLEPHTSFFFFFVSGSSKNHNIYKGFHSFAHSGCPTDYGTPGNLARWYSEGSLYAANMVA